MTKTNISCLKPFYLLLTIILLVGCASKDESALGDLSFNAQEYVDFESGNIPLIISVPHGGELNPSDIPNRTCNDAVDVMDEYTIELSQAIMVEFAKVGQRPYLIVNKIHRSKMDGNRGRKDATCGNAKAEAVWDLFHGKIADSMNDVEKKFDKGLFIDLHGHGNQKQRVELGYLMYEDELAMPDKALNSAAKVKVSSIQHLVRNHPSGTQHADLLRGNRAFGSLLQQAGFAAVPSNVDPFPLASDNYFSGGYNTANYGSYKRGSIDGIQVECNRTGVRDTAANRQAFAVAFVRSVNAYLTSHYFNTIPVQE
jgi:N-formylglutamate amidohydrolase